MGPVKAEYRKFEAARDGLAGFISASVQKMRPTVAGISMNTPVTQMYRQCSPGKQNPTGYIDKIDKL